MAPTSRSRALLQWLLALIVYLAAIGLDGWHIGLRLTLTLVGDASISLWLTECAAARGALVRHS